MSEAIPTPFPLARGRRLRQAPWVRAIMQENRLHISDLIWPAFLSEGTGRADPVASMPGIMRMSIDRLLEQARVQAALGVRCIALFPYVPKEKKSRDCAEALSEENLVCRATRALKTALPDMGVMLDVALDPYNADGHDGLYRNGQILNDETVECLVRQACAQARAGADILGLSDMMDGRVRAIREALERSGCTNTLILSYTAKFASAFYGPFREAVGSRNALKGDKRTYQLACANRREALRQAARDIAEGADMLMVKPGLPYLDICADLRARFDVPILAYQVSGEYAMIESASRAGFIDGDAAMMESLLAFRRAGCDAVISYFAPRAAALLSGGGA